MKQFDPITTTQPDSLHAQTAQASQSVAPKAVHSETVSTTTAAHTAPTAAQHTTEIPVTLLMPVDSVAEQQPQEDSVKFMMTWFDSSDTPYEIIPVRERQSLFATNQHSSPYVIPMRRQTTHTEGWIFGAIILLLALLSIYLNNQKFKLKDIFLSLFDLRVLDRVFRESNIKSRSFIPMTGIYLGAMAMTTLQACQTFHFIPGGFNSIVLFLSILGGLIVFITLKSGIIRLFGDLFEDTAATTLYIINSHLFYFVGALICTPLTLFLFYCNDSNNLVLKINLAVIAILFIIRILRGFQLILTNSKSGKLYLFYYLCIFEIVPIMILSKILIS